MRTALAVISEEPDTEGWLRLEVVFQDGRHADWALWQLSTRAQALEPKWLRDALHHRAVAIAIRYDVPAEDDRDEPVRSE